MLKKSLQGASSWRSVFFGTLKMGGGWGNQHARGSLVVQKELTLKPVANVGPFQRDDNSFSKIVRGIADAVQAFGFGGVLGDPAPPSPDREGQRLGKQGSLLDEASERPSQRLQSAHTFFLIQRTKTPSHFSCVPLSPAHNTAQLSSAIWGKTLPLIRSWFATIHRWIPTRQGAGTMGNPIPAKPVAVQGTQPCPSLGTRRAMETRNSRSQ